MQVTIIYALAYGSTVGLLLFWRLCQFLTAQAREHILSTCSKWIIYTIVLRRLKGSSDITVLAGLVIALLFIANIIGAVLSVRNQAELSLRLARLCATNLVFLYFGGTSNIMMDKIFRLSHSEQYVMHRWVGRVTVTEGLIHGTLEIIQLRSTIQPRDLSLYILFGVITLISVVHIRRRMYEIFLRTHALSAVACLVLLRLHVRLLDTYLLICFSSAASLYLLQKVLWFSYFLYRNLGSGPSRRASIVRFVQSGPGEDVIRIELDTKRPWVVMPGQFVYLSLPRLRSLGLGLLESHPFMIVWTAENKREEATSIVLLVQSCRGFTRRLQRLNSTTPALIDGPYGGAEEGSFKSYDKVLLMSSGIGIAPHLFTARYLIRTHNKKTARVRRLTLFWLLETQDQMRWAEEYLSALVIEDKRTILTIFISYPDETEGSAEGRVTSIQWLRSRFTPLPNKVNISWLLRRECNAEAGNMLVSVCGSPQFELCARQAVKSNAHDINFRNEVFQPDDTQASKLSGFRYFNGKSTDDDLDMDIHGKGAGEVSA